MTPDTSHIHVRHQRPAAWYWVDKVIVRRYAVHMTPAAFLVYSYLASRADEDGECWPAVPTIAEETGLSPNTVRAAIKQLAGLSPARNTGDDTRYLQLILVTPHRVHQMRHPRRKGDIRSHIYTLLDVSTDDYHLSTTALQNLHPAKIEGSISEGTTLQKLKGHDPAKIEGEQDPFDNKTQINNQQSVVVGDDPLLPTGPLEDHCSPAKFAGSVNEALLAAFGFNGGIKRNAASEPLFTMDTTRLLALLLTAAENKTLSRPEGWVIASAASDPTPAAWAQAREWLTYAESLDELRTALGRALPYEWTRP